MPRSVEIPRLSDFGPFLVQATPLGDPEWETFGAFPTREAAKPLEAELRSTFLVRGVDLDDEGSSAPTVTRVVSLIELLAEGSLALYCAIADLVQSADEHALTLGGNTEAMEALLLANYVPSEPEEEGS